MAINRDRAEKAIKSAEREFRNAVTSLKDEDYAGALKYFQECTEYAVKAVLLAYGMDYPKIHAVGRFLHEIREKYPKWFLKQIQAIVDVTDSLARGRPKFRYPYEYPTEQFETTVGEIHPKVKKVLESCRKLVKTLSN
ncbi:HEPN domain-containing protein [Candidatus Bathyarchaeota archaeon]|nr:MAG: HEPN domain-containing protein [Candidatus Bathyarchaeota archaeon]